MKNYSRFRFTFLFFAVLLLGSCSKQSYTFAPNTGSYHGNNKTTELKTAQAPEENVTAAASKTETSPAEISSPEIEAATALARPFSESNPKAASTDMASDKKSAKTTLKQLKKDLKQLKAKDIKDGNQVQIDQTVKLFLVLGLVFLLLGILVPILWKIGIILLIIALVFLVLNTL